MNPWTIALLLGVFAVGTETGRVVVRKAIRGGAMVVHETTEGVTAAVGNVTTEFHDMLAEVKAEVQTDAIKVEKPHRKTKHDVDTSDNYV